MTAERKTDTPKPEHRLCPECSASMVVVDQCEENGAVFTWYECIRDDCDGQWLEKEILVSLQRL